MDRHEAAIRVGQGHTVRRSRLRRGQPHRPVRNQADGKVSGLQLPCEVYFGDSVGTTTITYGGKKSTKTAKGETTSLVSWNVTGK